MTKALTRPAFRGAPQTNPAQEKAIHSQIEDSELNALTHQAYETFSGGAENGGVFAFDYEGLLMF